MIGETARLNTLWGQLVIEELRRCGVDRFYVSPGSRSTPLTAAAARHPGIEATVCLDERGAAFRAVGYARGAGRPAALVCTSGTAAANYLPAIVEASVDLVPMIVLTADRPPELRRTGANQTIDQPGMFGRQVRWEFDLPCPDRDFPPEALLTTVDQAVHMAVRAPAGPVHLNLMFREPLGPEGDPLADDPTVPATWRSSAEPYTRWSAPVLVPPEGDMERVTAAVARARRGILSVGRLAGGADRRSVAALAARLGWPVFADIRSGLRLGQGGFPLAACLDQVLLAPGAAARLAPDLILHLGGVPLSKRFGRFMADAGTARLIVVGEHPMRHDPSHRVAHRLEASVAVFADLLAARTPPSSRPEWTREVLELSGGLDPVIDECLGAEPDAAEMAVARCVSRLIPPGHALFLASSMPVRDMDMYGAADGPAVPVDANRGASGIDGTLASAIGFADGLDRPVTLITGDLSLAHDLSSLSMLARSRQPMVVVVIDNGGGGIFHFLPIASQEDLLEPFFATPQPISLDAIGALTGLPCRRVAPAGFAGAYRQAIESGTTTVLILTSDRRGNRAAHERLQRRLSDACGS
jgi:2-succinyl-5-enolpyruvyl-6-hydroxy-3-cyclohexene-1-carboxylate synthase